MNFYKNNTIISVNEFKKIAKSDPFKSFLLNGFGLILMFVQQIVFARILGENDFGIYSFIQSIYAISTIITTWGMTTLSSREIGAIENAGLKKGFYLFSHFLVILLNLIMGIIIINISNNFEMLDELENLKIIFIFSSIFFYLKSFHEILSVQYQAEGYTIMSKLSSNIIPIVLSILVTIIYNIFCEKLNLSIFFLCLSVALFFSALFVMLIKKPDFFHIKKVKMSFEIKAWIKSGLYLMALSGLYIVLGRLNSFIIGIYLEPKLVGYYSVCLSLSALVLFGLNATNQVLAPKIAKSYKNSDQIEFQALILKSTKIGLISTTIFILALLIFGKFVLSLFGEEFKNSFPVLVILSLGYLASIIAGPVGLSLTMTGREKLVILFTCLAAIVNFILSIVWVTDYGIIGVAYANAIGLVLLNVPLAIYVKYKFNYRTYVSFKKDFIKKVRE
ncbi:MAG: oligosaccharide flippase family protein [Crocinitomicaceae bacterium]